MQQILFEFFGIQTKYQIDFTEKHIRFLSFTTHSMHKNGLLQKYFKTTFLSIDNEL